MIIYSNTILTYNIYLKFVIPYLIANKTRLKLSTEQVTQLTDMLANWTPGMDNYENPQIHGTLSVAIINAFYLEFHFITQGFKQQLKKNAGIVLNETDYLVIGIHKDSTTRKKTVKPTEEALVLLAAARHLYNEYKVMDIANPTRRGKPVGVTRIRRKYLVAKPTDPIPTLADMIQMEDITLMTFDIPFTEAQVGDIVYLAVCFCNDAGDAQYSEIISSPVI